MKRDQKKKKKIMSRLNVLTVTKNTFFHEANYYEPQKYEEHFDEKNKNVKRENEEIKRILDLNLPQGIRVTDIGCGTGLGRRLISHDYTGIDVSEANIRYCKKHHEGRFFNIDADLFTETVDRINPVFLFSIDYLELSIIEKYIQKTDQVFVAVHYNRPYLNPSSVYYERKNEFNAIHPRWRRIKMNQLFREYGGETFPLLGEEYYWVTVIRKGGIDGA